MLSWPTITVQGLRIGADGSITVDGGWLDLQQPLALDLYGFGMEPTRVGFGTEDDGRRWVGVDGALRLTDLLPAGASARGLRVSWDPRNPGAPPLTLTASVSFGVPARRLDARSRQDDPATGTGGFTGVLPGPTFPTSASTPGSRSGGCWTRTCTHRREPADPLGATARATAEACSR